MIGIIDYGMGNLKSVQNALSYLNLKSQIIDKAGDLKNCEKIILPGVGAFAQGMSKLIENKFDVEIREFSSKKKPILGICLGMQLLMSESTEHGVTSGLDLIPGNVEHFSKMKIKQFIPHMGWNEVEFKIKDSELLKGIDSGSSFYFVHSFFCKPKKSTTVLASTNYGEDFVSMCESDNIFACQFHPEKSQSAGLKILENFGAL